jgi:protein disulfide-isomerase A1
LSEPLPVKNDKSLTQIVGLNFNKIVHDNTKDVLVKYYAPWSEKSLRLGPHYLELAEYVKDVPDLVVGLLDASANEIESE